MLRPIDKHNVVDILKGLNKHNRKNVLRKCYKILKSGEVEEYKNYNWRGVMSVMQDFSGMSIETLKNEIYGRKKKAVIKSNHKNHGGKQ
jgi:hypothetical protein